MGLYYVIDVDNEEEFNKQLQLYFLQKYKLESNFNGTAILKKKSYSMGLLIVLIIVFWPAALIYYFTASDDVVTIKMKGSDFQQTGNAAPNQQPVSYCPNCGEGLFEDSTFCPGCGANLNAPEEDASQADESAEEIESDEVEEIESDEVEEIESAGSGEAKSKDEILEECVYELVRIYENNPEGFLSDSAAAQPVKDIGEKLNDAGGFDLMLRAHEMFDARVNILGASRNLEFVWDGIGSWRG